MLKEDTLCIYLKAGIETLVRNLENDYGSRPMLKTGQGTLKERIEELMRQREAVYESTAAITVNIDGKTFGKWRIWSWMPSGRNPSDEVFPVVYVLNPELYIGYAL